MNETPFSRLEDVILDEAFPEVDLALRRGRHIDRDDTAWYGFLSDGQGYLEAFYRRFGAELVRRNEGYFYLLPTSDRLGRRQLSVAEMLVGQALTLLYLDPATVEAGGITTRAGVLSHLASVMGTESLVRALNPKRKKYDERVAQETVRTRVSEALRRLATLGFVDSLDEERVRLRPALMRFAEPVRGSAATAEALEQLVAAGEVVLTEGDDSDDGDDGESSERELNEFSPDEPDPADDEPAEPIAWVEEFAAALDVVPIPSDDPEADA